MVPYLYSELRQSREDAAMAAATAAAIAGSARRQTCAARIVHLCVLLLFALFYLLPLYVMVVNSLKTARRDPRRQHDGAAAALDARAVVQRLVDRRRSASSRTGLKPLFPQLDDDGGAGGSDFDHARRAQRLCADQLAFRGATLVFGLMLFGCFIPFQIVLIPMARILGLLGLAGTSRA